MLKYVLNKHNKVVWLHSEKISLYIYFTFSLARLHFSAIPPASASLSASTCKMFGQMLKSWDFRVGGMRSLHRASHVPRIEEGTRALWPGAGGERTTPPLLVDAVNPLYILIMIYMNKCTQIDLWKPNKNWHNACFAQSRSELYLYSRIHGKKNMKVEPRRDPSNRPS